MKLALIFFSLVVFASAGDGFPSAPFIFVGVPEKIRDGSYETIDGRVRSLQIRVVEVKKGSFREKEIGFDFPEDSPPPLEIGQKYLFTAVYDRHGIRYTDWKKIKESPTRPPQPTTFMRTNSHVAFYARDSVSVRKSFVCARRSPAGW